MREAREGWFDEQLHLDPDRVMFLDEAAAATNMARRDAARQGHYMMVLRLSGHLC